MMAEAAHTAGATPVFITLVSAIACRGATPVGTRGAYVMATLEAADESDVAVIDLHQLGRPLAAYLE